MHLKLGLDAANDFNERLPVSQFLDENAFVFINLHREPV